MGDRKEEGRLGQARLALQALRERGAGPAVDHRDGGVAAVEGRGGQASRHLREQQRGPAVDRDGAVHQPDALHHRQAFGVVRPHREGGDER